MDKPIVNPDVPYVGPIPGGLGQGRMARIQGVVAPHADRFNINLQCGPNSKPRDDTALHISCRLKQGYIARNIYENGAWGSEEGDGRLPIGNGQQFEVIILADADHFKIAINGAHFCEFRYRIPREKVSHLLIDGDVHITLISWEGNIPSAPLEDVSRDSANVQHSEGPQGPPFGAPPSHGYGNPGYGPPPGVPGYGIPQGGPGYGQQPPGYGPPGYGPPGAQGQQQESGLDHFFTSAQNLLTEAIATGAAEKLMSSFLGPSNQNFTPQNAQYGQYPHPQQQQQRPPSQNIIDDLNLGGGQGQGGLGSFLSSLARDVLNPKPRQDGQGRGGY